MQTQTVLVGSWTGTSDDPLAESLFSPGKGIYRFHLYPDGRLKPVDVLETDNPSWIVLSADQRYLYTTNESDPGRVSALEIPPAGPLKRINSVSTRGQHPTHACLTPDGKYLLVANYSASRKDAGFIVFPLQEEGKIGEALQHIPFDAGSNIVEGRQESGHAHSVNISPDGTQLFVADLGADTVRAYRYRPDSEIPFDAEPDADLFFSPGAGPRHMAFSSDGKFAYVVTEMAAQIHVYRAENHRLHPVQTVSLTDSDSPQDKSGAGLLFSPDGQFLYAGNRQQRNEIVVFRADPHTGRLSERRSFSAGGVEPRAFAFDRSGTFMLVANVLSDSVTLLSRNPQDGSLAPAGISCPVGTPTDVKFLA